MIHEILITLRIYTISIVYGYFWISPFTIVIMDWKNPKTVEDNDDDDDHDDGDDDDDDDDDDGNDDDNDK